VQFPLKTRQADVAQLGSGVVLGQLQPNGSRVNGRSGYLGKARAPMEKMVFSFFQVQHIGRLPEQFEASAAVI